MPEMVKCLLNEKDFYRGQALLLRSFVLMDPSMTREDETAVPININRELCSSSKRIAKIYRMYLR